jgi:hypothetical protein
MKKTFLTLLIACLIANGYGQSIENKKLIELGKTYKNFMMANEPTKAIIADMNSDLPDSLKIATAFLIQTVTTDNKLLDKEFLTLPDKKVLKNIFIIQAVSQNMIDGSNIDNDKLIDSLKNKTILKYELVDNYYNMLFTATGNKISPFNLSKSDFELKEYNLADDTEKGIFFLQCMNHCRTFIWGYMNIVKPANTKKAYDLIKKYPKFNGLDYYQFNDFAFTDFEMNIEKDKGMQSYKTYYIDKYYELLLYHLICLKGEGAKEKEINSLLLGSILKDNNLYKYTTHKEILESIFQEQK